MSYKYFIKEPIFCIKSMKTSLLIDEFCEYSLYIKGYSQLTIKRYKVVLNFAFRSMDVYSINEINEKNVQLFFLNGRSHRNWKANTYLTYHKTLRVFLSWCIKNKYYQGENFMNNIEGPRQPQVLPRSLKENEISRILESVKNFPYSHEFVKYRNFTLISMYVLSGLRKSELLKLRYSDIDIEGRVIMVRQGKGKKDRMIPMSFTLISRVQEYLKYRKKLGKTCPEFFTSYNRNSGFTEHGLQHLVRLIRKASGVRFTIHQLRHTFATQMLEGGCDIQSLSRMMGHSEISTTAIYLSVSDEHLKKQIFKHPLNTLDV